jgi:hypothetical protein
VDGLVGRVSWWTVGILVAANPSAYLADFEHVRVFGMFGAGDLKRVLCQRMLFASRKVSGAMTMLQSPRDFSLKCHPMMSFPVSDDGRCLLGLDERVSGVVGLRS